MLEENWNSLIFRFFNNRLNWGMKFYIGLYDSIPIMTLLQF